jgi:DeoR/GlpR family transcriptional regulator of sugar metabolism
MSILLTLFSNRYRMFLSPMKNHTSPKKNVDRKVTLLRVIQENEPISVNDLAQAAGLSQSTLRRELRQLVEDKLVKLNVGQVVLATSSEEMPYAFRTMLNIDIKRRIAQASLDLIQNGETIFIAGGTTTLELARLLPHQRRLTVITNALRVANLLVDVQGIELVVLGGVVRMGEQTLHGHLTELGVHQFRADKLFYGSEAINLQHGITHSQIIEVSTDRALANAATQVIILADHTKFGRVAPALVLPFEKVHTIVTDTNLPVDTLEGLRAKNIEVILV